MLDDAGEANWQRWFQIILMSFITGQKNLNLGTIRHPPRKHNDNLRRMGVQGPLGWLCRCRLQRNVVWNPSRRLQRDDVWHHPCSPGFPHDKIFDVKSLGAKIVHDPQNTNLTQHFCRPNLFGVIIFQAITFLTNLISLQNNFWAKRFRPKTCDWADIFWIVIHVVNTNNTYTYWYLYILMLITYTNKFWGGGTKVKNCGNWHKIATWIRKLLSIKLRVLYMISPYKPNFILSAPAAPASKCFAGWGVRSKNSKKTPTGCNIYVCLCWLC